MTRVKAGLLDEQYRPHAMHYLLFLILLSLLVPGVFTFIGNVILIGLVISGAYYGYDYMRVAMSSPMALASDSQTGYPIFDVTKDRHFDTYTFRKTIKPSPFILTGGIPTNYTIRMPIREKTGDQKISLVRFDEKKLEGYLTARCLDSLLEFDIKRANQILIIESTSKKQCSSSGCEYFIENFDATAYPEFSCTNILSSIPVQSQCHIDHLGNMKGSCELKTMILKRGFLGYNRQPSLENFHFHRIRP